MSVSFKHLDPASLPAAGMTVIYGGNASGKSGYARVMKRACRARDQTEPIHPNANDPTAASKVPACGIVFDDPVSSLDHWRRRNVAQRLTKEAKTRQVVVFTHDTSFLGQLCNEIDAESAGVQPALRQGRTDRPTPSSPHRHLRQRRIRRAPAQARPDEL